VHTVLRPSRSSAGYVATVAVLATAGFVTGTTWPILLAGALTVPASLVALPGYYLGYGLLALVPGANPDHSAGSGTVTSHGTLVTSTSAGNPAWFTGATIALGIAALVLAALVNVVLVRLLLGRRTEPDPPAAGQVSP
jgi:hypothetical protein